jgi:hypothetical protein
MRQHVYLSTIHSLHDSKVISAKSLFFDAVPKCAAAGMPRELKDRPWLTSLFLLGPFGSPYASYVRIS